LVGFCGAQDLREFGPSPSISPQAIKMWISTRHQRSKGASKPNLPMVIFLSLAGACLAGLLGKLLVAALFRLRERFCRRLGFSSLGKKPACVHGLRFVRSDGTSFESFQTARGMRKVITSSEGCLYFAFGEDALFMRYLYARTIYALPYAKLSERLPKVSRPHPPFLITTGDERFIFGIGTEFSTGDDIDALLLQKLRIFQATSSRIPTSSGNNPS
jgi:hypothetical protein